jgi:DNA-binding GntR family transcriptional regulator
MLTDDHEEMIRAIEARDVDAAERLAHAHTRQFRDSFFKYLARNLGAEMAIVPGD